MQIDRISGVPTMEFHVARDSRDRYRFDESLYTIAGNVIFANFHAARLFAQRMNQKRDLVAFPEQAVKPSQINALALIHELTHYMFRLYREQQNPQVLEQSLDWLTAQIGPAAVDAALKNLPISSRRWQCIAASKMSIPTSLAKPTVCQTARSCWKRC